MTKRIQLAIALGALGVMLVGCHGPLLGFVSEGYVNEKDSTQSLELAYKQTVKGAVSANWPNPYGWFTLQTAQKVTAGEYVRTDNTYVLKSDDNPDFKITVLEDKSLRDESGNIWRLPTHSRFFRPIDPPALDQRPLGASGNCRRKSRSGARIFVTRMKLFANASAFPKVSGVVVSNTIR